MSETLAQRLETVKNQIKLAAEKAGRNADAVKLIAVSKTHPVNILREAMTAGATVFGENKVQEAETKVAEIGRDGIEWHLIGHLQSNKVRKAVKVFDVIHTLDSVELAERIERICIEEEIETISVLIQVDLANETTKNGIKEADLPELVAYLKTCERIKFTGLMVIPPYFEDVEVVRPYFKKLREIRDEIIPNGELSMGMSHDFETAIAEGATYIRVGTAIFGEREYK